MASEDEQLRRSDVHWTWNGTVMEYVFVLAGLSMLGCALWDPSFSDSRPGVLDFVTGLVLGWTAGIPMGRAMARKVSEVYRTSRPWWRQRLALGWGLPQIVFVVTFFPALLASGWLSSWMAHAFGLGWPWFHSDRWPDVGAMTVDCVAYWISVSTVIEKWYRSLSE